MDKKIANINKLIEDNAVDYLYKFSKINTIMTEMDDKLGDIFRKLDHQVTTDKQL
jgi:hypothetical protein